MDKSTFSSLYFVLAKFKNILNSSRPSICLMGEFLLMVIFVFKKMSCETKLRLIYRTILICNLRFWVKARYRWILPSTLVKTEIRSGYSRSENLQIERLFHIEILQDIGVVELPKNYHSNLIMIKSAPHAVVISHHDIPESHDLMHQSQFHDELD